MATSLPATRRTVIWAKEAPFGAELAFVELSRDSLTATGVTIGSHPEPYRLEYLVEAPRAFRTTRVSVSSRGDGWRRQLDLTRGTTGKWTATVEEDGDAALPAAGGELAALDSAIDPDLGLSPLFNTMPVLRHGIHSGQCEVEFLMLWISVPDLAIHPSRQRYSYRETRSADERVVRFEDLDDPSFVADLTYDGDGLVVGYPGIATQVRATRR